MSKSNIGAASLLTEINTEHALLKDRIATLERICEGLDERTSCAPCSPEKTAGCAKALIQELGDLLAYMVEHFRHEERGMQGCGYADLDDGKYSAHVEDHANISEFFTRIVSDFDERNPCPQAVKLRDLLETWIDTHIGDFDTALFAHLTGRDRAEEAPVSAQ